MFVERATGIEPAFSAWEADVLPLNYARSAPWIGSVSVAGSQHPAHNRAPRRELRATPARTLTGLACGYIAGTDD